MAHVCTPGHVQCFRGGRRSSRSSGCSGCMLSRWPPLFYACLSRLGLDLCNSSRADSQPCLRLGHEGTHKVSLQLLLQPQLQPLTPYRDTDIQRYTHRYTPSLLWKEHADDSLNPHEEAGFRSIALVRDTHAMCILDSQCYRFRYHCYRHDSQPLLLLPVTWQEFGHSRTVRTSTAFKSV